MSDVDLGALRMQGPAPGDLPRRPLGPRLLVAAAVLLVLAVAATFVGPLLWPGRLVPTAAVRATAPIGRAGPTIAEAVGWVEADPFPTVVRPLVSGRIESIEVLEGAPVVAGQTVVARLASATLLAAKERAAALCAERERMADAAAAAHTLAVARRAQNAAARTAQVEARTMLAAKELAAAVADGDVVRRRAELRAAVAAQKAQEELHTAGSSNQVALERARADAAAAEAAVATADAAARAAANEQKAAAAQLALAEELVANPVDLDGAVAVAKAELQRARANCDAGRAELAIAERELGWATVKAPVSGVVLRLLAEPGESTGPDGDGIVSLYDPAALRARIDVPLASVRTIAPGQDVELQSEVTGPTKVRGVVQRLQHEADLLKNTLQVKVQLVDPPATWRPETLCRARFLGGAEPVVDPHGGGPTAFVVPKAAFRDGMVFVVDPRHGTARAIAVTKVAEQGDDVIVTGELSIAQRVVLAPVVDGEAIREEGR